MRRELNATGAFRVESLRAQSAVESFTTALQKRDVKLQDVIRSHKMMNDVLREQYALQNMQTLTWNQDARNRVSADAIIPRDVPERLGSLRRSLADVANGQATFGQITRETAMRVGLWSEAVRSAGHNLVNLGKNTQWAGRQMMVGIGVPFAALAITAGTLAYNVDKELTRIVKVYDNRTTDILSENNRLRQDSMRTAEQVAQAYGMAAEDSLNITAAFAATGETGVELQKLTQEVAAASLLGELDRQKAIDTTIALNTVLADTNYDVAESFRYMNALENATSLSMQDMTEAIPRLAGVVRELGGDITDIGTLMAAARAAGISAGEAANALKSISFRNVAPAPHVVETFQDLTDVNLNDLIEQTQGDVIPMIKALNQAMDGLTKPERMQAVRALQGIWRGNAFSMIAGQFGLAEESMSEMVKRAEEVREAGPEGWGEVWDKELRTVQESASARFTRAVETIKVQLAEIGEPFLEVASDVAEFAGRVLEAFNSLSDGQKQMLLLVTGGVALGTVGVMLLGVFLNLAGTVVRTAGSMGMLLTRFKSTNMEQKVAELTANAARGAYVRQSEAASVLAYQLGLVNAELKEQAANQAATMAAMGIQRPPAQTVAGGGVVPGFTQDANGRWRDSRGKFAKSADVDAARAAAAAQSEVTEEVQKTRRGFTQTHAAALGTVGAIGLLAGGTNKWVNILGMVAVGIAAFQPMFGSLFSFISKQTNKLSGRAGLQGKTETIRKLMGTLAPALGPLGIAIGAATIAWGIFEYRARKAREELQQLADAGDNLTKILGGTPIEPGQYVDAEGNAQDTVMSAAKKFKEEQGAAVRELEDLLAQGRETGNMAAFENAVIRIGLDVHQATGDAEKAKEAVQIALRAAGNPEMNIDMRFSNENWVKEQQERLTQSIVDAAEGSRAYGEISDELKVNAQHEGERLAKIYGQALSGIISPEDMVDQFREVNEQFTGAIDSKIQSAMGNFTENDVKWLESFGINPNSVEEIRRAILFNNEFRASMNHAAPVMMGLKEDTNGLAQTYRSLSFSAAKNADLHNQQGVNAYNLGNIISFLDSTVDDASVAENKLGSSTEAATQEMQAQSNAADELRGKLDQMATSAAQSRNRDIMQAMVERANEIVDDQHEARIERLKRDGELAMEAIENAAELAEEELERRMEAEEDSWEAEQEAFETFWDDRKTTIEEFYDGQSSQLEDQIEAEREAERVRQQIFERERQRVSRIADLYNQNADFNIALNSGNLDEAARIGNNIRATTEGWAIDDTAEAATTASERRISEAEERIELINAEKEAALKAYEEEREAAKKTAEEARKLRRQALEDERETNRQRVEDAKKARQDEQEAAEKSAQKQHEAQKRSLDQSAEAWLAYIPATEAQLQAHIGKFEGIYNGHDAFLNTKSQTWSAYVNEAMIRASDAAKASLNSDMDWALYGAQAAADFIQGAFGMDMDTFKATFGIPSAGIAGGTQAAPRDMTKIGGEYRISGENAVGGYHDGGHVLHNGGRVNMTGTRTGYPMNAPRRPSEVDTRLKVGEFVVNDKAVRKVGVDNLQQINKGILPTVGLHDGGPVGGGAAMGPVGLMGAMFAGMLTTIMQAGFNRLASGMGAGTGTLEAGRYGDSTLDAEQLANAMAIVNTGRSMRLTDRDIMIGLMTALQESSLRNVGHGDSYGPDSRGLFQQRSSWGSERDRMDPNTSARLFFNALLKVGDRNTLHPSIAAQRVQRSRYPMAYAKWQDEAQSILSMLGGAMGGGEFQTSGKYPPRQYWKVSPNTQAAANFVRSQWGINNIGLLGTRKNASDHPWGKAMDVMIPNYRSPQGIALGTAIANWFVNNPNNFGTKYVIWRQMINSGSGWRRMEDRGGDTANHFDHPHVSFYHEGGVANIPEMRREGYVPANLLGSLPQLLTGGEVRYDNTIANLHKNEKVLTAPLSAQLEQGIGNLANGGGNEYNITMDLRGSTIDSNFDIDGALDAAIKRRESRLGRSRKIT